MTDLLTSSQKANIHTFFDNIHDTFSRDIYLYVFEDETFVDTDGNHNPLYGNPERERTQTPTIYTKKARVLYDNNSQREYGVGTDAQLNVNFPKGTIRLKVDSEAYQILTKSKKIRVDDRLCELISSPSRPGPFNPNYWTIFLQQVD